MSVLGLGNMGVNWVRDVPADAKISVMEALLKSVKNTLNKIHGNNIKVTSGKDEKSDGVEKDSVKDGIRGGEWDGDESLMTVQSVSNILYGLSLMDLGWENLSEEMKENITQLIITLLHNTSKNKELRRKIIIVDDVNQTNKWKNKKKKDTNSNEKSNKDDQKEKNELDANSYLMELEPLDSRDFRFLLSSLAAIRFDVTETRESASSSTSFSTSSSTSLTQKEKLKNLLLELFIQFANKDDVTPTVTENDTPYKIEGNTFINADGIVLSDVMTSQDFFSVLQFLGA
jgi:hypothetical protein